MATRPRSWLVLVTFFAAESVIPIAAADWRVGTVADKFFVRRRTSSTRSPPSQSRPPATNGRVSRS